MNNDIFCLKMSVKDFEGLITIRLGLTIDGMLKDLMSEPEKREYVNALIREINHMEEKIRVHRHKAREAQRRYYLRKKLIKNE